MSSKEQRRAWVLSRALVKTGDVEAVKGAIPEATSVRSASVDDATAKDISTAAKQAS